MPVPEKEERLRKELGLFDVYAISTGAMFSSGFFLLPGLAAAQTGPSVVLAYLIAGFLIMPAMLSMAELSTAMPRAGGAYYFLDRSLGPMVGTVGGLGTFLALALKSAFALVGMGAYLAIFVELPIKPLAVALTVAFMALNIFGAKETTGLQRLLVIVLLSVLAFFTAQGLFEVLQPGTIETTRTQFSPFMPFGWEGLFATVGLVFVSYAGLTKVASVSEEVKDPDRNIPLGMGLSLLTATCVYVIGVFVMVSVLDAEALRSDLTPVATASEAFFDWLPQPAGLILIVAAAIAAFASTGNAGLMSASRYPLAMARDRLLPDVLSQLGRFKTPTLSILLTGALMIFFIVALDVAGIAKLASAFQLAIFMLVNLAVIVMRQSKIESYDPGYTSPLYPWTQVFGIVSSLYLIMQMGGLAIIFTAGMTVVCLIWYFTYAHKRVRRDGAIYHWFARLGQHRFEGLDYELRGIMKEKGLRDEDPFDKLVISADVIDLEEHTSFEDLAGRVAEMMSDHVPATTEELKKGFLHGTNMGTTLVGQGVCLPHLRLFGLERPHMVLVRSRSGMHVDVTDVHGAHAPEDPIHALFFLVGSEDKPRQHLRILASIAETTDADDFMEKWLSAENEQAAKEILLRTERYLSLWLRPETKAASLIGKSLREARFPAGSLVALIWRQGQTWVPRGDTVLRENDRLTIIGDPQSLQALHEEYAEDRLSRQQKEPGVEEPKAEESEEDSDPEEEAQESSMS